MEIFENPWIVIGLCMGAVLVISGLLKGSPYDPDA